MRKFPELTIIEKGSSGIEIRALPPEKFNCVEFTLRDDVPQPVLISPWMQFESVAMSEWRLNLANEIARRAAAYERLVKKVDDLQRLLEQRDEIISRKQHTIDDAIVMWQADRVKAGLPVDFSDIKLWPDSMMSGYHSVSVKPSKLEE